MTALITFAQDFQDFHLVRGDRFAPFKCPIPRFLAGLLASVLGSRLDCNGSPVRADRDTVILSDELSEVKGRRGLLDLRAGPPAPAEVECPATKIDLSVAVPERNIEVA